MQSFQRPDILPLLLSSEGIGEVIAAFVAAKVPLRFVGGAVRDVLAGRPITDIDLATPSPPEITLALLEARGLHVVPTGLQHGTVTVYYHGQPFEITTLRQDVACDGRRATVAFTDDWQADAARRDFTFNALSCSLEGVIYDYFGGVADLEQGAVRFVGEPDTRIEEDFLRILRFFRFHAYYGKVRPDEGALYACHRHAASLASLSGERIQSEMLKILLASDPVSVLLLMQQQAVLPVIFPVTPNVAPLEQLVAIEYAYRLPASNLRRLALLLRNSEGEQQQRALALLAKAWKLSGRQVDFLKAMLAPEACIAPTVSLPAQKKLLRQFGKALFQEMLLVSWAEYGRAEDAVFLAMLTLAKTWEAPAFPLNGRDLQMLGIVQGKQLGDILRMLEAWWEEEGYSPSKAMLLQRARDLLHQAL